MAWGTLAAPRSAGTVNFDRRAGDNIRAHWARCCYFELTEKDQGLEGHLKVHAAKEEVKKVAEGKLTRRSFARPTRTAPPRRSTSARRFNRRAAVTWPPSARPRVRQ